VDPVGDDDADAGRLEGEDLKQLAEQLAAGAVMAVCRGDQDALRALIERILTVGENMSAVYPAIEMLTTRALDGLPVGRMPPTAAARPQCAMPGGLEPEQVTNWQRAVEVVTRLWTMRLRGDYVGMAETNASLQTIDRERVLVVVLIMAREVARRLESWLEFQRLGNDAIWTQYDEPKLGDSDAPGAKESPPA
jgi:hypothetical protein